MQVVFKWGVTVAPRLNLIDQHQQNADQRWNNTIDHAFICSQKEFDKELVYDDDYGITPFASTSSDKIKNFFLGRNMSTPVNVNVTYKSFFKLVEALKKIQETEPGAFDIIMENFRYLDRDEAHNMVPRSKMKDNTDRQHFEKLNNGVAWLNQFLEKNGGRHTSWTASPLNNGHQWDMSNTSIHGTPTVCRGPDELRQMGEVVRPRLINCIVDDKDDPEAFKLCGMIDDDIREFTFTLKTMTMEMKYRALTGCPVRIIVFSSGAKKTEKFRRMTKMLYPDWKVFNVTAETPPADRNKMFDEFKSSDFAVLYNYDIISEGSDLDGASAVVLGRNVGKIKLIQIVGRVVRITVEDKEGVKVTKTLKIDDPTGWKKFFGHIYYYMETQDPESTNYYSKLKSQLQELYSHGYSSIVEDSVVIKMPSTDENVIKDPYKFANKLQEDKRLMDKIRVEINDIETMENECREYYDQLMFQDQVLIVEKHLKKGRLDDAVDKLCEAVFN